MAEPVEPSSPRSEHAPPAGPDTTGVDVEALVDRHGDALFRYAMLRLRDRHAAEDLVQEAFLAAIETGERFEHQSRERTWLIGILRHKLLDYWRKQSRQQAVSQYANPSEDQNERDADPAVDTLFNQRGMWQTHPGRFNLDPDDLIERDEFWQALSECIEALPERQARAFSLRSVDEVESAEVCQTLGITSRNLWVLLHRARTRLRDCLEGKSFGRA
jgi:RNA polymerase sigma-70 factor (ECF subfamily)